jgi:hypothetical protein
MIIGFDSYQGNEVQSMLMWELNPRRSKSYDYFEIESRCFSPLFIVDFK